MRSAYGISWTYLIGDVAHEGYKAYLRNRRVLAPPCEAYKDASDLTHEQVARGMVTGNIAGSLTGSSSSSDTLMPWPTTHVPLAEDYRTVMAQRAVFQGIASMGLPAFTIHSVVKYSGRMLKNSRSVFFRTWAPIGVSFPVRFRNTYFIISVPAANTCKYTSSVSPSCLSSPTYSTSPSKRPSNGPSIPDFVRMLVKMPSVRCLRP